MFYRNRLEELKKWRIKDHRKLLLIKGARQVGGTTTIRQFAAQYKAFIYLNREIEVYEGLLRTYPVAQTAHHMQGFEHEIQEK